MPIDPVLREITKQISEMQPESLEGVSPQMMRENSRVSSLFGNTNIPMKEVRNLKIPAGDAELDARLYSASEPSDSLVIYYHGGGFVLGDLDSADEVCRMIAANSGSKVISVAYRLAPEHKFPVPVQDAFNSYRWIREHSSEFNVNSSKIAVAGDSAGGNLAAALCLVAVDEKYPLPRLNIMYYPVVASDISSISFREYSDNLFLTREFMEWFHNHYINTKEDLSNPYFSLLLSPNLSKMPETIVVSAEYDPLRDQGETLVSELRGRDVEATGIRAMGMVHGFLGFFKVSENARNILVMTSMLIGKKLQDGD